MRSYVLLAGSFMASLLACSGDTTPGVTDAGSDLGRPGDVGQAVDTPVGPDGPGLQCSTNLDATAPLDATVGDSGTDTGGAIVDAPPPDRPPPGPPPASETCAGPFAPCVPVLGTTVYVRVRGTLIAPDAVTCDGEVLYATDTGRIVCAGTDCGTRPEAAGATVVCSNGVIAPGLIDPHQHMAYNHLPVWQHPGHYGDRAQWQAEPGYHAFTQPYTAVHGSANNQGCRVFKWAELRSVMGGATAIIGSPGYGACDSGLARNLDVAAASGLPPETLAVADTFPLRATAAQLAQVRANLTSGATRAWLGHLGEGIDGNARGEFDSLQAAGLITAHVALVHGSAFTAEQLAWLVIGRTTLVWSPRSNIDLYGETAEVTAAHALGVPIALGVDWTPSGSVAPLGEIQCADHLNDTYFDRTFSDRELVTMATATAAHAANLDDRLGRITAGYLADLLVVRGDRTRPYRAVIDAHPASVRLVTVGGHGIYGDTDALAGPVALNAFCEPVPGDVCGTPKTVCLRTRATAETLVQVRDGLVAALNAARAGDSTCGGSATACYDYALDPLYDPATCTAPERARCDFGHAGLSGVPTDTDYDGDGVPDATDLCPRVFDPPRIVATQDDVDGDHVGDACDPCPLTPGTTCPDAGPDDVDGDRVPNAMDDCPTRYNPDQADADHDGHGDLCDRCPMVANPGNTPCPQSLTDVRNPAAANHPSVGSAVQLTGLAVTAIRTAGTTNAIWVQDPTATAWGGIEVFFGSTAPPTVAVGNRVSVAGTYAVYNGSPEIDQPTVTVTDTGTTLPFAPRIVCPGDIATGGAHTGDLQGMLVEVQDVSVVNSNPDAPAQQGDYQVTAALRVGDYILDNGNTAAAPVYPVGMGFRSVTGVLFQVAGYLQAAATNHGRRGPAVAPPPVRSSPFQPVPTTDA